MRWTDHKTVGLQYGLTALFFLLVGFLLMILMRWQLAWPGQPLPSWLAPLLGEANAPGGVMLPEFYNQLVAMHGSVMVFLAVVPLAAWWLDIGLWQAFVLDIGIVLFFLPYTFAFNWTYDHLRDIIVARHLRKKALTAA